MGVVSILSWGDGERGGGYTGGTARFPPWEGGGQMGANLCCSVESVCFLLSFLIDNLASFLAHCFSVYTIYRIEFDLIEGL